MRWNRGSDPGLDGPPTEDVEGAMPPEPVQDRRFGRYEIIEELGSGGTAVVYRAHDPELDRDVALKLVRPASGARAIDRSGRVTGRRVVRLLREARALAELDHPNVVEVFDVGEQDHVVFMSMRLVEGESLQVWLSRGSRSWREILDVFLAAGEGLWAAHQRGLVHRDFKPANVLVGFGGRVTVVDFGLVAEDDRSHDSDPEDSSVSTQSGSAVQTEVGSVSNVSRTFGAVGTPVFMAPEQHVGVIDPRSDQFAFCVSLFQALYRERAFDGESLDALRANKEAGLRRPTHARNVPSWLFATLRRGTAADPDRRYDSMGALLLALRRGGHRRRKTAMLASLGTAALFAAVAWPAPTAPPCDAALAVEQLWPGDRRDRIEASFMEDRARFALATWAQVEVSIRERVQAQHNAAVEVCRQRDDETPSPTLDTRFDCLRQSAEGLHLALDLLEAGQREPRTRAIDGLDALPDATRCIALDPRDGRFGDPAADEKREALSAELDQVELMLSMGAVSPGRERLTAIHPSVQDHEDPGLRARWFLAQSRVSAEDGDAQRAEAAASEAYALATEAGADDTSAKAAIAMLRLAAAHAGDVQRWDHAAKAAIGRLAGRDDLEAQRLLEVAMAEARALRAEPALELAERGWSIAQRVFENRPEARLAAAEVVVRLRHLNGRNIESLELAEATRAEAIARYGRYHPAVARQRASAGNALLRLGRYEEAEQELIAAIAVFEDEKGPGSPRLMASRINLGHVQFRLGRLEAALETYGVARASATGPDQNAALALLVESEINMYLENWDAAHARAAEARVLIEELVGTDSPLIAAAYSQEALVYVSTGAVDRAWPMLEAAEELAKKSPLPIPIRVHVWSTRGKALLAAGRAEEAVPEFEKAVALQEQVGAEVLDRAQVDFHLARALHETGEEDRALALGRDALATFVALGPGARVYRQWTEDWLDEIGAAR